MGVALSPCLMYLSQVARLLCLHMQTVAAGGGGRVGVGGILQKSSRGTFHTFFFFCPPQRKWDNFASLLILKGDKRRVFGLGSARLLWMTSYSTSI